MKKLHNDIQIGTWVLITEFWHKVEDIVNRSWIKVQNIDDYFHGGIIAKYSNEIEEPK